jgi:hypothetical protein
MYLNMMSTQKYLDFKATVKNFSHKLGGNDVAFKTRGEWMNWIGVNISKTSFTSVQEFGAIYDAGVTKSDAMIKANQQLFNYLQNADDDELIIILAPEKGNGAIPPYNNSNITVQSCFDNCVNAYESAYDSATSSYYNSIGNPDGSLGYAVNVWLAVSSYEHTIYETLPLQFNACVGGC